MKDAIGEAVEGVDWHSCGCRPGCPASLRGRPCRYWMGYASDGERDMPFCPRCGWARDWHPEVGDPDDEDGPLALRIPAELLVIGAARSGFRLRPVETATPRGGLL